MENLDERQIKDVIQNFCKPYANKNVNKIMSYLSDNPKRVVNYSNETAIGKENVKATYIRQFELGKKAELTCDIISVAISQNTATVSYNWHLSYADLENNEINLTGKNTARLIKVGESWKVNEVEENINS